MSETRPGAGPDDHKKEREQEATSQATVKDVTRKNEGKQADSGTSTVPSPDGSFDQPNELEDSEPI